MNGLLEHINSAGQWFAESAGAMLVQSSVLIVILLLADFLLRKKVRAVFRYWLWMLVLVKLVLPVTLSTPFSLGNFVGEGLFTEVNVQEPVAEHGFELQEPLLVEGISPVPEVMGEAEVVEPAEQKVQAAAVAAVSPLRWEGVVFLVWAVVVLVMMLMLLQRAFFVFGLVAQAGEASERMRDELEEYRLKMGMRGKIGLRVSANATSPAVCGLFRPVILVPQELGARLTKAEMRAVLMHELSHIKRGDLWVNLVQTVLQIVYFYNPLLWVANAVIRRVREQAVDEAVLVAMGEGARQYPETLVNVAKMAFGRPALSLRLIGVVESKSALAGRVKRMLERPLPKSAKLGIAGLVIVLLFGSVLLPMAKVEAGAPELVIKGVVTDAGTGEPIAGARVFDDGYGPGPDWGKIQPDERGEWGAVTNLAGEYSFLTWPEHHSIKVEAPGYKAKRENLYSGHFTLNKKDEEIFDFELEREKAVKKLDYSSVTVEEGVGFDDIIFGCTGDFIKSRLGKPDKEIKNEKDWWLNYKKTYGLGFWVNPQENFLIEIRLNKGFKGKLTSGVTVSSTKEDVFKTYGKPIEEKTVNSMDGKYGDKILYKQRLSFGQYSKIHYDQQGLLFWFVGNKIYQIVVYRKNNESNAQQGVEAEQATKGTQFIAELGDGVTVEDSRNLLIERRDILQKKLQTLEQKSEAGLVDSKELQQAKIDLLRVESELAQTPQKRIDIDILDQIVTLYLEQEKRTQLLLDAGRATQDELNEVKLLRLEAETELAKAEGNNQQADFKATLPNGVTVEAGDIKAADFDISSDVKRGVCNLVVSIQNDSDVTIPKFKLKFYRGDPSSNLDEAGNVHSGWYEAGPIEPDKRWNERTRDFHLADGQYEFNVVLDYDDNVAEVDEGNNQAVLQVRVQDGEIVEKSVICPGKIEDSKSAGRVEGGGERDDPSVVPSLIEKLRDKDENWAVKKEAGESLVEIGDPRAFQPLLDALRDECETERKIETIYPPLRHGYISPDESIERIFSDALKDFIEKAEDKQLYVRSLFEYLNDSRTPKIFRYRLGIILGGLGEKKAAPTLIECLEKSDRGEMRVLSAWLLGEMGVREAIPHLKQALKDDFVSPGHKVTKNVGEGMIESGKMAEGKTIFSAMEIIPEEDYYRVRVYTVRNSAAAALQSLGIKVVKSGNGYKIIESEQGDSETAGGIEGGGESGDLLIFESYFPDDLEAGKKLDEWWANRNSVYLDDEGFFELFRKGLRRCTIKYKGNFPMQYIGGKYIWHKEPDESRAIDIMYHASFSSEFKYYAVYSGLSAANPKSERVLKRLVDLAMEPHQLGRIIWGVKSSKQGGEFMALLEPYLEGSDPEKRERAEIVAKALRGEIDAGKWEREYNQNQRTERTIREFSDDLVRIRKTFLAGTSEERLEAIKFINRNLVSLTHDESFVEALDNCSKDENPDVRAGAASILGGNYISGKSKQPEKAIKVLLRLSEDENKQVRYNAVYFGLSVIDDKSEEVVRRLIDMALADEESDMQGRLCWGLRKNKLARGVLLEYLEDGKHDKKIVTDVYRNIFDEEPPRA